MSLRRLPLLLFVFASALCAAPARAVDPAEGARAVELGHEGLTLFQKGALAEAYARFAEAEAIVHSPVFLLHMARAKRGLGDPLTARGLAVKVAREPLPAGAPASWLSAQTDAIRELSELDAQLPSLLVTVEGARGPVTLTLDGAPLPEGALAAAILQNPGDHTLSATQGEQTVNVDVTLPAEAKTVEAKVVFPPVSRSGLTSPSTKPEGPDAPQPSAPGSVIPGAVVLGVGSVALGVGLVTGLLAQSKADEVLSRCTGDACLASDKDAADAANSLATVSTIGWIVGAVAVPTGITLLVLRPWGKEGDVTVTSGVTSAKVRVRF